MFLDTWDESKKKEDFKWPDDIHALKLKAIKKWAFLRESERRSFINRALDVHNIDTGKYFKIFFITSSALINVTSNYLFRF
jgi:hypothetical protein